MNIPGYDANDPQTRLILAGLELFGKHGFDAVTTRAIATHAGANHAAISYYFGGKDGLYLAVAKHVAAWIRALSRKHVERLHTGVARGDLSRQDLADLLAAIFGAILRGAVTRAGEHPLPQGYILREYASPGPAFDVLYDQVIHDMHTAVTTIAALALDLDPESEEAVVRAHAVLGMCINFALARVVLLRRLKEADGYGGDYPANAAERIVPLVQQMACQALNLPTPNPAAGE